MMTFRIFIACSLLLTGCAEDRIAKSGEFILNQENLGNILVCAEGQVLSGNDCVPVVTTTTLPPVTTITYPPVTSTTIPPTTTVTMPPVTSTTIPLTTTVTMPPVTSTTIPPTTTVTMPPVTSTTIPPTTTVTLPPVTTTTKPPTTTVTLPPVTSTTMPPTTTTTRPHGPKPDPRVGVPECLRPTFDAEEAIVIRDESDLFAMQSHAVYTLANDIQLSQMGPVVAKLEDVFFEGNGHTILNLRTDGSETLSGLFGEARCVFIQNLTLRNVAVKGRAAQSQAVSTGAIAGYFFNGVLSNVHANGGSVRGQGGMMGGLVGYATGFFDEVSSNLSVDATLNFPWAQNVGGIAGLMSGEIRNSSATGNVTGTQLVGGLIGSTGKLKITKSFATGIVSGHSMVGGLVGRQISGSTLSRTYAKGSVTAKGNMVGGLVGSYVGDGVDAVRISDSFATGNVLAQDGAWAGGLIGHIDWSNPRVFQRVYASGKVQTNAKLLNPQANVIGGLVGGGDPKFASRDSFVSAYWNKDTSGVSHAAGASYLGLSFSDVVGKSSSAMQSVSTFSGWDFVSTWIMRASAPELR